MTRFEGLIREATDRFGLGTQGAALLNELLALIGSGKTGGLGGFLERFRAADLGDAVASWVSRGENRELAPLQLETVLGKETIARIASKVGLAQAKAASAMAFLVPKVVDTLTPDGSIPAALPADLRGALRTAAAGNGGDRASGIGRWWIGALFAAFAGLGWLVHVLYDRPAATTAGTPPPTPAAAPAAAPAAVQPTAPAVAPRLALSNLGGTIEIDGVVADEATRGSIREAVGAVFATDRIEGDIRVDAAAAPAGWLGGLRAALEHLRIPGADLLLDGRSITVGGFLGEAERAAILDKLRAIFGGEFTFAQGGDKALELFQSARERALAALAGLKAGYSAGELVDVLNLAILRFDTGSAELSAESVEILDRAAAAIKAAPAGTIIEISGHTDSTGEPVANMALSQARAEAVRAALIGRGVEPAALVAQGYGDTRPVASNDTPQGRFQNRRIEFVVVR